MKGTVYGMNIRASAIEAFDQFPEEGVLIGSLIVTYGQIEWDLCLMVGAVLNDRDTALKAMYRTRSASTRLDVADALVRQPIANDQLRRIFERTIAELKLCSKIRNTYAHTQWVTLAGRVLGFINLEDVAKSNVPDCLTEAKPYALTLTTLRDQVRFFGEVRHNIVALNWAHQALRGEGIPNPPAFVENVQRPEQAKHI